MESQPVPFEAKLIAWILWSLFLAAGVEFGAAILAHDDGVTVSRMLKFLAIFVAMLFVTRNRIKGEA